MIKGGRRLCKSWNDARGCSNKQCSDVHGCDIRMPDGSACLSRGHNRQSYGTPTPGLGGGPGANREAITVQKATPGSSMSTTSAPKTLAARLLSHADWSTDSCYTLLRCAFDRQDTVPRPHKQEGTSGTIRLFWESHPAWVSPASPVCAGVCLAPLSIYIAGS